MSTNNHGAKRRTRLTAEQRLLHDAIAQQAAHFRYAQSLGKDALPENTPDLRALYEQAFNIAHAWRLIARAARFEYEGKRYIVRVTSARRVFLIDPRGHRPLMWGPAP